MRDVGGSATLSYNLALCYHHLGLYSLSSTFAKETLAIQKESKAKLSEFGMYCLLGVNYTITGDAKSSKTFLDKAHKVAIKAYNTNKSSDNKVNVGATYVNYGSLFRSIEKWEIAIDYLDTALSYLQIGTDYMLEAHYQKTCCLMATMNYQHYAKTLEEGIKLARGNETYTMLFKALQCMANPSLTTAAILYNRIIPYMLKNNYLYAALDYCVFLSKFYKEKGKGHKKRALEAESIEANIRRKMHKGGLAK